MASHTPSLYRRVYDRLGDLIPNLANVAAGDVFFAPARINDDMALHCHVMEATPSEIKIELAHDLVRKGEECPVPWMEFKINLKELTAELVAIQDANSYYRICTAAGHVDSRRAPLNLHAVNWLQIFINTQFAFRPFINSVETV